MVTATGLSLPATVQHFVVWRDPDHFFGAGKPFGRQLLTYDLQTLAAMEFLQTDAHPGDVALTADNLIAVLAHKMPGADGLFRLCSGSAKRLHAQADCSKQVLGSLA
jgi:hypothetical protein